MSAAAPATRSLRPAAPHLLGLALLLGGCGSAVPQQGRPHRQASSEGLSAALVAQARPIGRGARFEPRVTGPVLGACRRRLGARYGVHVEVFARDRVVLLPAGIGTPPPRRLLYGRLQGTRCYGDLVTLDPTGLVLVRPGRPLSTGDLFRSWGQRLSAGELAGFPAPAHTVVRAYVDGRRWLGRADRVPLRRHAEIVLEVSPFVPPHAAYTFPPGI